MTESDGILGMQPTVPCRREAIAADLARALLTKRRVVPSRWDRVVPKRLRWRCWKRPLSELEERLVEDDGAELLLPRRPSWRRTTSGILPSTQAPWAFPLVLQRDEIDALRRWE